jgi:hypothetical protein
LSTSSVCLDACMPDTRRLGYAMNENPLAKSRTMYGSSPVAKSLRTPNYRKTLMIVFFEQGDNVSTSSRCHYQS